MSESTGFLSIRAHSHEPSGIYTEPQIVGERISPIRRLEAMLDSAYVNLGWASISQSMRFAGAWVRIIEPENMFAPKREIFLGDRTADVSENAVIHIHNRKGDFIERITIRKLNITPHLLSIRSLQIPQ